MMRFCGRCLSKRKLDNNIPPGTAQGRMSSCGSSSKNLPLDSRLAGLMLVLMVSIHYNLFAQAPAIEGQAIAHRNLHHPELDTIGDPLPPQAIMRLGTDRFRHPSGAIEMAIAPDGRSLVTINSEDISGWDTASGRVLWSVGCREVLGYIPGAGYGQQFIAFANDSSTFYTPGANSVVLAWNTRNGSRESIALDRPDAKEVAILPSNIKSTSVDVTGDGKLFAVGHHAGAAMYDRQGKKLWSIDSRPVAAIDNLEQKAAALLRYGACDQATFSPDEKLVAVVMSENQNQILLLDTASGKLVRTIELENDLLRLEFSPDGQQIMTTQWSRSVQVRFDGKMFVSLPEECAAQCYRVEDGEQVWDAHIATKKHKSNCVSAISYSPDGKRVAIGATIDASRMIQLLDAESGRRVSELAGLIETPWSMQFSSDSRVLYSAGVDTEIRRWNVETGSLLPLPEGHRASEVATVSPDGKTIAVWDSDNTIMLVRVSDGVELRRLAANKSKITAIRFSADATRVFAAGTRNDDLVVESWSVATGESLHRWNWPQGFVRSENVNALSVSSDGSRAAIAVAGQGRTYLFNPLSGKLVAAILHGGVSGLDFSPDSQTLTTVGLDNHIRRWNASTGELVDELNGRESLASDVLPQRPAFRMCGVVYSPNDDRFAITRAGGQVSIWQAAKDMMPRHLLSFEAGEFSFGAIAFSPDGMWIATGASIGTISLFDSVTGKRLWNVASEGKNVHSIEFGNDNRRLLTGADGKSYLWDLVPKRLPYTKTLNELWLDLGSDVIGDPYHAMWAMVYQSEQAVPFIAESLDSIETVFDLNAITKGQAEQTAIRRLQLAKQKADVDPSTDTDQRIRNALVTLRLIDTEASRAALHTLSQSHALQAVRDAASLLD